MTDIKQIILQLYKHRYASGTFSRMSQRQKSRVARELLREAESIMQQQREIQRRKTIQQLREFIEVGGGKLPEGILE